MPKPALRVVRASGSQIARMGKLLRMPANLNKAPTTLPREFGGSSVFTHPNRGGAAPLIAGPYPVYPGNLYAGAELVSVTAINEAIPEIGFVLEVGDIIDTLARMNAPWISVRAMRGWTDLGPCLGGQGPSTNRWSGFKTGAHCLTNQGSTGALWSPTAFQDSNVYAHEWGAAHMQLNAIRYDTVHTYYRAGGGAVGWPYISAMPSAPFDPIAALIRGPMPRVDFEANPNLLRKWQEAPAYARPVAPPEPRPNTWPAARPAYRPGVVWRPVGDIWVPTRTVSWTPSPVPAPYPAPVTGGIGGASGPGSGPSPGQGPTPQPSRPPVVTPPPRLPKPPPKGTKEKKMRSALGAVLGGLDTVSELSEIIDQMYQALPRRTRWRWEHKMRREQPERSALLDQAGQYGISGADWKLQAIYHNWDEMD